MHSSLTKRPRPPWSDIFGLVICTAFVATAVAVLIGGPASERNMALFALILFFACGVYSAVNVLRHFRTDQAPRSRESTGVVVKFDDEQIAVRYGNGTAKSLRWSDLVKVGIVTTDEGPMRPDVFWGLHSVDDAALVVYPQEAQGAQELLTALQTRLEQFDNEQVIRAMGSADNAQFVVWTRPD